MRSLRRLLNPKSCVSQATTAGVSLVEVIIAGVLLTILALGALTSLKSTTGFTTRAGRFSQSSVRILELGEPSRNQVQPGYEVGEPPPDTVTLMEVGGDRALTSETDPCATPGACPGGAGGFAAQMNRVSVRITWDEPDH